MVAVAQNSDKIQSIPKKKERKKEKTLLVSKTCGFVTNIDVPCSQETDNGRPFGFQQVKQIAKPIELRRD